MPTRRAVKPWPSSHSPHPQHKVLQTSGVNSWEVGVCVLCAFYRAQNDDPSAAHTGGFSRGDFFTVLSFCLLCCGWPSPDSGQSSIQGFGFNTNDLWLRQPRKEFTQTSRNRDIYLVVLIVLGKIHHIIFLNFPTGLNRTNMNLSGPWEIMSVPASEAASAHSAVGDHPGEGGVHTGLDPRLPQLPQAVFPFGTGQRQ